MRSVGRVTEISCKSSESFEDAIRGGIERASKTLRNITSAWVKETRVEVENGAVKNYVVVEGGIAPDRIQTISFGEDRPLPDALGHTEEDWQRNRRAHIEEIVEQAERVIPIGG
jgi:hypothetical protein